MDVLKYGPQRSVLLVACGIAAGVMVSGVVQAQGLHVPDQRLPRLSNGRPNLTAPAPKARDGKPDLSGIWNTPDDKYLRNLAADGEAPLQPAAAALYKERQNYEGKDRPSGRCLPRGVPSSMLVRGRPWKFVQAPGVVLILYDESIHYRQIFTDGRGFPDDRIPTWFGYSIGKWEGDTLVVDTIGVVDDTWLDNGGHPHSDALHLTERFRRRSVGTLDIGITVDDPKTYTKPWTAALRFDLVPDTELTEHVCAVHESPTP
jgi:hypothetical protein